MRILILGAGGGMGRYAARTAATYASAQSLTLADLNLAAAEKLARELGDRASGIELDINDRFSMREELEKVDLVLNTVGPFYELGLPVLEQVIDAGCDYVDICDDWEPTLDMLSLSGRAEDHGSCCVIGLGASPGVSNMLAMLASKHLDETDEIVTGWSIASSDMELSEDKGYQSEPDHVSAAVVHWMHQISGKVRVFSEGGFDEVAPLRKIELPYPGYGNISTWTVGHPEAVTLPRAIRGLSSSINVMVGPDNSFTGLRQLRDLIDTGVLSLREAAAEVVKSMKEEKRAPKTNGESRKFPALFAWAKGKRDGQATISTAHMTAMPPGGMGGATGVPQALAIPLLEKMRERKVGVFVPEELIDPDDFFDALAPHCSGDHKSKDTIVDERIETLER